MFSTLYAGTITAQRLHELIAQYIFARGMNEGFPHLPSYALMPNGSYLTSCCSIRPLRMNERMPESSLKIHRLERRENSWKILMKVFG